MKLRVAVIYGGRSGEHDVSLRSAKSIIDAMDPDKYKVIHYVISKEGKWRPRPITPEPHSNPEIDVVFPILHGTFGEDGTIQGLLELAELPYGGAGVLASAVSMDKEVMKRLAEQRGLPVSEYTVLRKKADFKGDSHSYPVFVKPANLGSSVGISKARDREELVKAIDVAFQFDRKVVIERAIIGREFECSVLGNEDPKAAIPCEILPSREFYDYEDKYLLDAAKAVIPADLTPEQTKEVQRLAVECYRAVECEGMARVDFLLENATGKFYINEINTIPGFTSISMYPKMWEYCGLPMPRLIDRLIELAMERGEIKKSLRYTR
jgi:D-alanine-D-alanine ligase